MRIRRQNGASKIDFRLYLVYKVSMTNALHDSETLRETVKLLYLEGFKPAAISSRTGVKPGTVKIWLTRMGVYEEARNKRESGPIPAKWARDSEGDASRALRAELSGILANGSKTLASVKVGKNLK